MSVGSTCRLHASQTLKVLPCNSSYMVFGNLVNSLLKQASLFAISNRTMWTSEHFSVCSTLIIFDFIGTSRTCYTLWTYKQEPENSLNINHGYPQHNVETTLVYRRVSLLPVKVAVFLLYINVSSDEIWSWDVCQKIK